MFQHCTHLTLQYVESDACMMELRFAVCNMNLPLVVVVVGTGDKWKRSEVRVQSKFTKMMKKIITFIFIYGGIPF